MRYAFPLILAAALLSGCRIAPPPTQGYFGPTLPMTEVVARVNQNNVALPTLFARHYVEANLWDAQKKQYRFINADGDLFVRKPLELLMRGRKDIAGEVFEMGSDGERYWLKVFQNEDQEWWGWLRNAGKPCAQQMPVQPDLVGEVLGIGDINTDFLKAPVPTMRFNNDKDVYMFVWSAQLPDRWYAQKEIWYDRKTFLPLKVLLFDHDGRIILVANLTQHRPVNVGGGAAAPQIATHYALFFPETKSTMTIKLSDVAMLSKAGQPKPGMIRFREDPRIPPERVIQIDKDCDK